MKRIYRSKTNRVLVGVCGGLGEHFGLDPLMIRIIWAAALLIGGTGLVAYLIAWTIIPLEHGQTQTQTQHNRPQFGPWLGISLILIGVVLFLASFHMPQPWHLFGNFEILGPIALIAVGIFILISIREKRVIDESGKSPRRNSGLADRLARIFRRTENLYRSRNERMLLGICGGLSEKYNIDPVLIRLGFVVLTMVSGGWAVFAYFILYFFIPLELADPAWEALD